MFNRMMTAVCIAALFTTGLIATEPVAKPKTRSLTEIRKDVSDALRAEATARKTKRNTSQVLRLVDLYLEMASHPNRDTSPLLTELGVQVRLRLLTVREQIKQRISEKAAQAKKNSKPATVAAKDDSQVLDQQAPAAGAQQGAVGQGAAVATASSVAARPTDLGPDLVELIEAVVSPSTWRINGGNGAVVYYAPLHVLVVSAPDEVHAQVGNLVKQLHAAQRRQDGAQAVVEVNAAQGQDAQ
jgi:hypothetical protein